MGPDCRRILSKMHYIRWIQKWLWRKYINSWRIIIYDIDEESILGMFFLVSYTRNCKG